jgi:hypothetical protein
MDLKFEYLGGYCPVQAEGTINGCPFYFRARGNHWSFYVSDEGKKPLSEPTFERREKWGNKPFAAGYMPEKEAKRIIQKCAEEFENESSD